jgi:hypothetical protein
MKYNLNIEQILTKIKLSDCRVIEDKKSEKSIKPHKNTNF